MTCLNNLSVVLTIDWLVTVSYEMSKPIIPLANQQTIDPMIQMQI